MSRCAPSGRGLMDGLTAKPQQELEILPYHTILSLAFLPIACFGRCMGWPAKHLWRRRCRGPRPITIILPYAPASLCRWTNPFELGLTCSCCLQGEQLSRYLPEPHDLVGSGITTDADTAQLPCFVVAAAAALMLVQVGIQCVVGPDIHSMSFI